jgi:two-component system chemotaxis response regulator CheY
MFPADSKVLVVDDSSFSRNIVKNGLKELSFWRVYEAESAAVAQAAIEREEKSDSPIQLMIADIHMPEMTGIELLKWVRGRDLSKGLPVIIITSSQEKSEVVHAAKLGVSHFMIKPFDVNILKDRLVSAWSKHGQHFSKK